MHAIDEWHGLLGRGPELTAPFCREFAASMRERRLTFGDRVHCPFLRPFFLSSADEQRIRAAAEALAAAGERVVAAALASRALLDELGMSPDEIALAEIDPRYSTASTASRADAFLLPDSLHFAEYNAESPAGLGYTQRLCELFDGLDAMRRFRSAHAVRYHRTIEGLLDALLASYAEWGGRASPPTMAIVDWREVPTWTEFEILRDAFEAAGVPTIVCDPRDLAFESGALRAEGRRIDLLYRRVLVNDIVARRDECRALVDAYAAGAVCMANTLRCKIPHKKAFFAVLTDERFDPIVGADRAASLRRHVPWTRVLRDGPAARRGRRAPLPELARDDREQLVIKPNDEYGGKGVVLGWETAQGDWERAIEAAVSDPGGTWIVQERIPVRRETFPQFDDDGRVTMREMLVDFAPYLFRGRMAGYLTRLSGTGLANVTSGGGQVPAFVVD